MASGLTPEKEGYKALLSSLLREVAFLKSLAHPNVLRYIGNVYKGGMLRWMVTELATGGSLKAWLDKQARLEPPPPPSLPTFFYEYFRSYPVAG